ncbi:hypothetical protein [Oryzifoliimicrobium ureilyticus]
MAEFQGVKAYAAHRGTVRAKNKGPIDNPGLRQLLPVYREKFKR